MSYEAGFNPELQSQETHREYSPTKLQEMHIGPVVFDQYGSIIETGDTFDLGSIEQYSTLIDEEVRHGLEDFKELAIAAGFNNNADLDSLLEALESKYSKVAH